MRYRYKDIDIEKIQMRMYGVRGFWATNRATPISRPAPPTPPQTLNRKPQTRP